VEIFINNIPRLGGLIMSETIKQTINMLEMLPDQEQNLALEIVKRLVLAWDPDFTKLTPEERRRLEAAENGEYLDLESIEWNNIDSD
jgi:hypothetical protein